MRPTTIMSVLVILGVTVVRWSRCVLSPGESRLVCAARPIKVRASTSVFGDGRISTYADPTRGQRAGQIGRFVQRADHARCPADQRGPAIASAQTSERGPRAFQLVRFWASGEQTSQKYDIPCPGKFRPLMCKNSENGAKLPTSKKSSRATHAGERNGPRFEFASLPKRWPVVRQRYGPYSSMRDRLKRFYAPEFSFVVRLPGRLWPGKR